MNELRRHERTEQAGRVRNPCHRYQHAVESSTDQRTADHENEFLKGTSRRLEMNGQCNEYSNRSQPGHFHCAAKY
jgi:hypothetical protein